MPEEKKTKFCSNCGAEIDIKAKICPKCGVEQPIIPEKVSNWWYLPPIFLGIIGGLVAWVVNKDVNPKKAKKLLIIGIVIPIVWIIAYFGIMAVVLVSTDRAREAARDTSRMADMRMIVTAQEMYYGENDAYYTSVSYPSRIGFYMVKTPTDPKTKGPYGWVDNTRDSQKFCAYADLKKGGFYIASHKGNGEITKEPFTLSDCEKIPGYGF